MISQLLRAINFTEINKSFKITRHKVHNKKKTFIIYFNLIFITHTRLYHTYHHIISCNI